jgi:cell wall-associated protease
MKKLLFLVTVQLFTLIAVSQFSISNTKWMVHSEIPQPGDLIMDFKKDTLSSFLMNGTEIGRSVFSQHNDSLLIHKLAGTSPCPIGSEGWYRIEWLENGEKFLLHLIEDECYARSVQIPRLTVIRKIKASN